MRTLFLLNMIFIVLCAWPAGGQAREQVGVAESIAGAPETETDKASHTLDPVVVRAGRLDPGLHDIGAGDLELMPSMTGSLTEALKGISQVQFDNERQSSLTLGEIAPPRVSISGAKPYENNFLVDGMSISNTLDPSGFAASANQYDLAVGGSDVTIFYDTHLLESVSVYASNVPARYGGFLGGVVDARLRDPGFERWRFQVAGRHTRDSWFKLRDVDPDSETAANQPRFSIYDSSIMADGPLGRHAALLLSASRRHAIIPLKRKLLDESLIGDDQKRTSDNYFVRLLLTPAHDLKISIDATYAPYEELRWQPNYFESEWIIENRSWRFATVVDYALDVGVVTGKVAYAQNGFSRDSANAYRFVLTDRGDLSRNDRFGGVGDAEIRNRELNAAVSFMSDDIYHNALRWNFTTGLDYGYKHTDAWNETTTVDSLLLYEENHPGNARSLRTLAIYDEVSQSRHLGFWGAHAQTELIWQKLRLRPGVRADHDNFTSNTDLAPRFKAEYDTFGNGALRVFTGVNRYYGQQLRGYAFKRWRPNLRIQTTVADDGTETTASRSVPDRNYRSGDLSTPYSDELTGGVAGSVAGFDYTFTIVSRRHRKQLISQVDSADTYHLTNNGQSRFDGVILSLSRMLRTERLGRHFFALSATRSRTRTENGSYLSEIFTDRTLNGYRFGFDQVFYNGDFRTRSDLPAENFNAPLILALTVDSSFFNDRLRLFSVSRWRDSARGLIEDKRFNDGTPYGTTSGSATVASNKWVTASGVDYADAYRKGTIAGGLMTDLAVELDVYRKREYELTLIAEVVNLFNGKMETSVAEGGASTHGRGYYAGVRMRF